LELTGTPTLQRRRPVTLSAGRCPCPDDAATTPLGRGGLPIFDPRSSIFLVRVQQLPQLRPGAVQPAADGADGHLQDCGHVLVLLPFHVLQDQHHAVLRGLPVQGRLDAPLLLGALQAVTGSGELRRVKRLQGRLRESVSTLP
jgi:hypothetical protein